jgi:hypothetical protein
MLRQARNDRIDANDSAEPIENADATDPIEPIERADPTDPIESTESREPIERSESCDQSDHFEFSEPACTRPILKPGHPAARGRPAAGALTSGPTEPESVPKPGPRSPLAACVGEAKRDAGHRRVALDLPDRVSVRSLIS